MSLFAPSKELLEARYNANKKLVELLANIVEENKNAGLRFCQILHGYDFAQVLSDDFFKESTATLKQVSETMKKQT